jgi:hypothetical protein
LFWAWGSGGEKFSPLHTASLSIENRIDLKCFDDPCRLRQSGVAMQHVSAQCAVDDTLKAGLLNWFQGEGKLYGR